MKAFKFLRSIVFFSAVPVLYFFFMEALYVSLHSANYPLYITTLVPTILLIAGLLMWIGIIYYQIKPSLKSLFGKFSKR